MAGQGSTLDTPIPYDDPYARLGVSLDAGLGTIKRAYRRLARKFHPDLQPTPASPGPPQDDFLAIRWAYETLSDPQSRSRYDQRGQRKKARRHRRSRSKTRTKPKTLLRGTLELDLEDALHGTTCRVHLRGKDAIGGQVQIKVPPGIKDGEIIRPAVPSLISVAPGSVALYLRVRPHPHWKVVGNDIHATQTLPLHTYYGGGPLTLNTPWGPITRSVSVEEAAQGWFVVPGYGLRPASGKPGDLRLELILRLPENPSQDLRLALLWSECHNGRPARRPGLEARKRLYPDRYLPSKTPAVTLSATLTQGENGHAYWEATLPLSPGSDEPSPRISLQLSSPGRAAKTLSFRPPANLEDDKVIRLRRAGWPLNEDGEPLDLRLRVALRSPTLLPLPVDAIDALSGARIDLASPSGRLRFELPAGIQSGDQLLISNLRFEVQVVPPPRADPQLMAALENDSPTEPSPLQQREFRIPCEPQGPQETQNQN